jgi:hypothetical protein
VCRSLCEEYKKLVSFFREHALDLPVWCAVWKHGTSRILNMDDGPSEQLSLKNRPLYVHLSIADMLAVSTVVSRACLCIAMEVERG